MTQEEELLLKSKAFDVQQALKPMRDAVLKKLPSQMTKWDLLVLLEYETAFWDKQKKEEFYKPFQNYLP